MPDRSRNDAIPRRSPRLFRLFRWYARRYLARHFHAVRVSRAGPIPDLPACPVVVVANHPSWWDPLIALVLTEFMPVGREHYAPIEAVGLAQYRFLSSVGLLRLQSPDAGRGGPVPEDQRRHPGPAGVGALDHGSGRVRRPAGGRRD